MKKLLLLFVLATLSFACKTEAKKEIVKEKPTEEVKKEVKVPEALAKVLKKHGGIEAWQQAKTLSYKLKEEEHVVDLHSRKTLITSKDYSLGYDGKETWLSQKDSTAFKGNPKFYYNLYFYFYAMPFVLADDGIVYSEVTPFVHDGISYPGVKIGYNANVGTSPDDNYIVYYNAETYQMEWLGYTVTYFSKKPSEKVSMIRYNNWEDVNGFLLPKEITWYKVDEADGVLKASGKAVPFSSPSVSQVAKEDSFYKNLNQ